jgi:hypothetical protein
MNPWKCLLGSNLIERILFISSHTNFIHIVYSSADGFLTARWYSSWILFGAIVPIFIMYGFWGSLTLLGKLQPEESLNTDTSSSIDDNDNNGNIDNVTSGVIPPEWDGNVEEDRYIYKPTPILPTSPTTPSNSSMIVVKSPPSPGPCPPMVVQGITQRLVSTVSPSSSSLLLSSSASNSPTSPPDHTAQLGSMGSDQFTLWQWVSRGMGWVKRAKSLDSLDQIEMQELVEKEERVSVGAGIGGVGGVGRDSAQFDSSEITSLLWQRD